MITQIRLKEALNYNKETGIFTWINNKGCSVKNGEAAGTIGLKGYRAIGIDGNIYAAHRLAFLYMEGEMPIEQVDHKNRQRDDNRWCNLRHADYFINAQNKVPLRGKSNNKSGIYGVYKEDGRWRARGYELEGKPAKSLGRFKYFLQACAARWEYEALSSL